MKYKKLIYSFFALFVFALLWNGIVHLLILRGPEEILPQIGRKEVERNLLLSLIQTAGIIVLFIISYTKWMKHGNMLEGLKHGLFFGILAGLLVDLNQYLIYPVPFSLVFLWFIFGTVEFCLYGIILSFIVKETK